MPRSLFQNGKDLFFQNVSRACPEVVYLLKMNKKYFALLVLSILLMVKGFGQSDIPVQQPLKIDAANKLDPAGNTDQGTALKIPSVIDNKPEISIKDSLTKTPVKMLPEPGIGTSRLRNENRPEGREL